MKYILLTLALMFTACDRSKPAPEIAAPQKEALDKAKAVEQTLQKDADETKKKADDAAK